MACTTDPHQGHFYLEANEATVLGPPLTAVKYFNLLEFFERKGAPANLRSGTGTHKRSFKIVSRSFFHPIPYLHIGCSET